jgi:hypothetical protein
MFSRDIILGPLVDAGSIQCLSIAGIAMVAGGEVEGIGVGIP